MTWRIILPNRTWTDADFTPDKYARNFPLFFQQVANLISSGGSVPDQRISQLENVVESLKTRLKVLEESGGSGGINPNPPTPIPNGLTLDFSQPANSGLLLFFPV